MMCENIEQTIRDAKMGDPDAMAELIYLLQPLIIKYSIINGRLDEDLRQYLVMKVYKSIHGFKL